MFIIILYIAFFEISRSIVYSSSTASSSSSSSSNTVTNKKVYIRPQYIQDAIENNKVIHYFGIGSNMLKEKVVNRGLNGTKIEILNIQAAYAKNHRLAFNLPGFPPIEPAMAGIEPSISSPPVSPLSSILSFSPSPSSEPSTLMYEQQQEETITTEWCDECHGALITMTASEYQKLWLSEGGGQILPGYQEILVDVRPYNDTNVHTIQSIYNSNRFINVTAITNTTTLDFNNNSNNNNNRLDTNQPQQSIPVTHPATVQAIALRAADHVRLKQDRDPSSRYMKILVQGAQELGLSPLYIQKLQNIPTAQPSLILTWLAYNHLYTTSLLFRYKLRFVSQFLSKCLVLCYVSSKNPSRMKRILSEVGMGLVLLPGSLFGYLSNKFFNLIGKPYKPFFMAVQPVKSTEQPVKPSATSPPSSMTTTATTVLRDNTDIENKNETTVLNSSSGTTTAATVTAAVEGAASIKTAV